MKKQLTLVTLLLMTLLLATGCGTGAKQKYSGFLEDYSQLRPVGKDGLSERYQNPNADLSKYNKLAVDRIMVWHKADSKYKGIDPAELNALTGYFYKAIIREFKNTGIITYKGGPGVMRLRVAITDVVGTKAGMSAAASIIPYVGYADYLASETVGSFYIGEVSIEAEVLDSQTQERLVALVERKPGDKYDFHMKKDVVGATKQAADSYFKSFQTWGYAHQAFDFWAKRLRQRWDEVHKGASRQQ